MSFGSIQSVKRGIFALSAAVVLASTAVFGAISPAAADTAAAASASSTIATRLAKTASSFGHPNGDVTALGHDTANHQLAIGGDFTQWTNPDGSIVAANKFVVVNDTTGKFVYTVAPNSYIRSIAFKSSGDGTFFIGGDFTSFGGQSRSHLAAINAKTGSLTTWNPGTPSRVRAVAFADDSNFVFAAGDGSTIDAFGATTGRTVWSDSIAGSGAGVHALLVQGDYLYAGGSFASVTTAGTNHTIYGLAKLKVSSGALVTVFHDTELKHPGGMCDTTIGIKESCNDIVLSLGWAGHLVVGIGGVNNEIVLDTAGTGERYWMHYNVGDVQAVADVNGELVYGFHRNHNEGDKWDHGHPLGQFAAAIFLKDTPKNDTYDAAIRQTPLEQLSGVGSNNDGGNNGIQALLTYTNGAGKQVLVAGTGATQPAAQRGLTVIGIN